MWPSSVAGEDDTKLLLSSPPKQTQIHIREKQTQNSKVPCELITHLDFIRKWSLFDFVISTDCTSYDPLRLSPPFPSHRCHPGRCIFSEELAGLGEEWEQSRWGPNLQPSHCSFWCHMPCPVQLLPLIRCGIRESRPISSLSLHPHCMRKLTAKRCRSVTGRLVLMQHKQPTLLIYMSASQSCLKREIIVLLVVIIHTNF